MGTRQGNHPSDALGRGDPQQRAPLNNSNHHRLHLRIIDNETRTNREDVLRVTFGILDAPLTWLNTADTGYYAITDDNRTKNTDWPHSNRTCKNQSSTDSSSWH